MRISRRCLIQSGGLLAAGTAGLEPIAVAAATGPGRVANAGEALMPDPRFFEDLGPVSLRDLAELCGAALSESDAADAPIRGVGPLDRAGPGQVRRSRSRSRWLPGSLAGTPARAAPAAWCWYPPASWPARSTPCSGRWQPPLA